MKITKKTLDQIKNNKKLRVKLAEDDIRWFIALYFSHHVSIKLADYHSNILDIFGNPKRKRTYITAFRGSGKTTLCMLGILWSILGKPKKKYVCLLGLTRSQVAEHFVNIIRELENNERLINDFGPFKGPESIWRTDWIDIDTYGAKIASKSRGETIRGAKRSEQRPDLIICDDIEDVETSRNKDSRERLYEWFNSEVLPLGYENTKIVVIGNLVHPDCFLQRISDAIKERPRLGEFIKIPFYDEDGIPTWKERYPNDKAVQDLKDSIIDPRVWKREYELIPTALSESLVNYEDIQYYDVMPSVMSREHVLSLISIDPACGENETNDFNAMVSASIFRYGADQYKIFIHPYPVNKRMKPEETIEVASNRYRMLQGYQKKLLIENTGFQDMIAVQLQSKNINVERSDHKGISKYERYYPVTPMIKNGVVQLPRQGSTDLVDQIVNFGSTRHDDLLDAFVYLLQYFVENLLNNRCGGVIAVECTGIKEDIDLET